MSDGTEWPSGVSWLFPSLAEVSHTLAGYPRLCEKLLMGELLSFEFNIDHIEDGRGRAYCTFPNLLPLVWTCQADE